MLFLCSLFSGLCQDAKVDDDDDHDHDDEKDVTCGIDIDGSWTVTGLPEVPRR